MYSYTRPNVYKALIAYIKELFPNLEVSRGNRNRTSLPPNTDDYALIWVHFSHRRGTNIRRWEAEGDKDVFTESASRIVYVEIDFCGKSALEQAEAFETAFSSLEASAALGKHDVYPQYIDAVDDATFVNDQQQYTPCYRVYAYLGIQGTLKRDIETFDKVNATPKIIQ
jgi:hypothetical protein